MAKVKYEVVATLGEYKNGNGETKRRYQKCGVILQGDKGFSLKLDTIPVNPEWNGWFSLFEPKPRDQQQAAHQQQQRMEQMPQQSQESEYVQDDDIPF